MEDSTWLNTYLESYLRPPTPPPIEPATDGNVDSNDGDSSLMGETGTDGNISTTTSHDTSHKNSGSNVVAGAGVGYEGGRCLNEGCRRKMGQDCTYGWDTVTATDIDIDRHRHTDSDTLCAYHSSSYVVVRTQFIPAFYFQCLFFVHLSLALSLSLSLSPCFFSLLTHHVSRPSFTSSVLNILFVLFSHLLFSCEQKRFF